MNDKIKRFKSNSCLILTIGNKTKLFQKGSREYDELYDKTDEELLEYEFLKDFILFESKDNEFGLKFYNGSFCLYSSKESFVFPQKMNNLMKYTYLYDFDTFKKFYSFIKNVKFKKDFDFMTSHIESLKDIVFNAITLHMNESDLVEFYSGTLIESDIQLTALFSIREDGHIHFESGYLNGFEEYFEIMKIWVDNFLKDGFNYDKFFDAFNKTFKTNYNMNQFEIETNEKVLLSQILPKLSEMQLNMENKYDEAF